MSVDYRGHLPMGYRKEGADQAMTKYIATFAVLVPMIGAAHAEQFPFREPGPDRTIFMETSNRECLRMLASHLVPSTEYCECISNAVAYGMTMTDAKELQRDHATPSFLTMQQTAKDLCATQSKLITGR